MDYSFKDLKEKTVAQLREITQGIEHEALKGYTQLNKEHLIEALCKALNIDMFEHHHVEGINKKQIKTKIKELKTKRDEALAAKDHQALKQVRRSIHKLKRTLHKATV